MLLRRLNLIKLSFPVRTHTDFHYNRMLIGNREIVGYGSNGEPSYVDRTDFPFPAIRWKESTPDFLALREKEKGDWKVLSKDEKKQLYRASYRQTFSEMKAPTGKWKSTIGIALFIISLATYIQMGYRLFVFNPLPDSFKKENQEHQLRRMLDLHVNPVTGISSKWDYEKERWKK